MAFSVDSPSRFLSTLTLLLRYALRSTVLIFGIAAFSAASAQAQCPAFGKDTACGIIITITIPSTGTAAQASVTLTGQGPFDGSDDTLVGVINNTSVPISSLSLTSGNSIFAFDGDGVDTFGAPGNTTDTTGYGGPNAYFTNINGSSTTGTVNFITPVAANGGTAYFSLEDSLAAATVCSSIINNSVKHSLVNNGTGIVASFTPNSSYTLAQAATLCGFTGWDWQQTVTSLPLPSPFFAAGSTVPLHAPPPFNDPPPNGYAYQVPPNAVKLPVYWNLFTSGPLSLTANEPTPYTLNFGDAPADNCLPGGSGASCGGKTAPKGVLGFTTHLVGLGGFGPGYGIQDTGVGFSWTSNFNGTSGGISVLNGSGPVDPGSGTGGITVTTVSSTTAYQYPSSVGVSAINGATLPTATPPPPTLLGAGEIAVTSSGLAYSRVTQTLDATVTITNVSNGPISGPFQVVLDSLTAGVTLKNATGMFGGWPYITVAGTLAAGQSATFTLQLSDPTNVIINFSPVPYSGSFN